MKFARILTISILLIALFFTATNVLASPAPSIPAKNTPGAQATSRANEKATPDSPGGPKGKPVNVKGEVMAIDPASITIQPAKGDAQTFVIDAQTAVKIPSLKNATLTDIKPGMTVMVHGREKDGAVVAQTIQLINGKPTQMHHVGTVTAYVAGASITITNKKDGETFTFNITADTKILPAERASELAVGSLVTIICPRDVTGGIPTAKGIVVHPAGTSTGTAEPEGTEQPKPTKTPKP